MRIFSWNVNGLRAVLNKGALQKLIEEQQPDILCLQEIKCKPEQIDFDFNALGYDVFYNPAKKPGYSGTAILLRKNIETTVFETVSREPYEASEVSEPRDDGREQTGSRKQWLDILAEGEISVTDFYASENSTAISEGRIAVAEFQDFYLVNVYTPNSKPDLSRLSLREKNWDPEFLAFLKSLEKEKPVITCGDFNAAHEEIDIARPKTNHRSAGFTDEERQGITNLINAGFIDTFRKLHPDEVRYTWWSHWGKARENNVGWRIDYFFVSESLLPNLVKAEIFEDYLGSDHCPIMIEVK